MSLSPDPAKTCYTLGKAWPDCVQVFHHTWARAKEYSDRYFANYDAKDSYATVPFRLGGTIGAATGGLLFCSVGFVLQTLVVGMAALVRLTLTAVFWLAEWLWRIYWRIYCICDDCGHSSSLPAYLCDKCGALHRALLPNHLGIFTHECTCGNSLRSSMFSDRSRHSVCCPVDGYPITHYGLTPVLIALGGGPRSGKTSFLYRSLTSLTQHHADVRGWQLTWREGDDERFQSLGAQFLADAIRSTPNEFPTAFRLTLAAPGTGVDRILRIYDPGGEAFQEQASLDTHAYYTRIAGAVFIIDPFAQTSVRSLLGETGENLTDLMPADEKAAANFERLLDTPGITHNRHASSAKLAIVISKADARDLLAVARNSYPGKSDHEVGRAFLIDHGLSELVSQAESHFRDVRFFFGGRDDRAPFDGEHALDAAAPLLWIIDQTLTGVAARLKG